MTTSATRRLVVDWLDDSAAYRSRAAECGTDVVPVLLPGATARAASWDAVLHRRFAPRPPTLAAGRRLVVAWGEPARAVGRLYARHTGADLSEPDGLESALRAVEESRADHVVVLAAAQRLTVAVVGRLSATCRSAGATLGLLCGRDEAALSFAAAKALLRPHPDLTGVDVLDAPAHRSEENRRRLPDDAEVVLRRPTLVKLLRTHGEGGHAKLPGGVLCGLLDPSEFPSTPEIGCARSPRRCKRSERPDASVTFADELAAPVVIFLCCNGFNVAGELFPSPVSMALGLAEGQAAAVLAPVRPLVATDAMMELVRESLTTRRPLGELVAELNVLAERIGQRDTFVLHGDPAATVLPAVPPVPATRGLDRGPDVRDLQDYMVRTLTGAVRARRLVRSAAAWWGAGGADTLRRLGTRLDRLEQLAVNAVKWAETDPERASRERLARTATLVRLGVAGWDRQVAALLVSARGTVDAFDLGHYDQVLAEVVPGPACTRCATPTETHVYGRAEPPDEWRAAVLCPVCGPATEGRTAGLRLALRTAPTATIGDELVLTAGLVPPPGPLPVEVVALHLRLFDKANDACVHDEARSVPAVAGDVEFRVTLPADLGTDLHSVRLVGMCGFDVAYARTRFAGLPPAVQT